MFTNIIFRFAFVFIASPMLILMTCTLDNHNNIKFVNFKHLSKQHTVHSIIIYVATIETWFGPHAAIPGCTMYDQ